MSWLLRIPLGIWGGLALFALAELAPDVRFTYLGAALILSTLFSLWYSRRTAPLFSGPDPGRE